MSKLKELLKSSHIQIALATGISIIVLAYFSKRVLPRPIGYLPTALPPFLMVVYEAVLDRYKDRKICTAWYWVVALFVATALVIALTALAGPQGVGGT
jgi:predicted histidine transporter YuiF (NhaC family)